MRIQSLVGNIRKDGSFKMKKRLHWVKRRWNAHCTFWEHPFSLSTISRTMKTWHREKFSEPNLALFSGVTVIDLLLSPPGGDSRKWVKAMFLEKGGLCQTKLLNKRRGGEGQSAAFLSLWNSHHSASRRTWLCCTNSSLRGYVDMWAEACFPSILGVHRRKGEYVSLLNAIRGPHSMSGDPRRNLSILGVTASMRVYFHW